MVCVGYSSNLEVLTLVEHRKKRSGTDCLILTFDLKLKLVIQKVPKSSYSMIVGLYAMIASIAGGDF